MSVRLMNYLPEQPELRSSFIIWFKLIKLICDTLMPSAADIMIHYVRPSYDLLAWATRAPVSLPTRTSGRCSKLWIVILSFVMILIVIKKNIKPTNCTIIFNVEYQYLFCTVLYDVRVLLVILLFFCPIPILYRSRKPLTSQKVWFPSFSGTFFRQIKT